MPSSSRTNRFQSFTPLRSTSGSLRRLRTAFSPNRASLRSASPSSILTTSTITSPLTRNSSPHSHRSTSSNGSEELRSLLTITRKPSVLEFEIEQERQMFGHGQLDVLEPRPSLCASEVHVMGIFEVLSGKC